MTTNISKQITSNEKWSNAAARFVKDCERNLHSKIGAKALNYLHSLGLNDQTLHHFYIGFNTKDVFYPLDTWGLPPEYKDNGNVKKVWLPRGIVIPRFYKEQIHSIKIRRYLTREQKDRGEQEVIKVKGSLFGLFGVENLTGKNLAILTDTEFDAMLMTQECKDLAGAVSFGETARSIGVSRWGTWIFYFLPISRILIPYTHVEETQVITDALPFFSNRALRAYLPDPFIVKTITDLKKTDIAPREWLLQVLNDLEPRNGESYSPDEQSKPKMPRESALSEKNIPLEEPSSNTGNCIDSEESYPCDQMTIDLNGPWYINPRVMPDTPCYCCNNDEYWQRPDGGWVCSTCHPNPMIFGNELNS